MADAGASAGTVAVDLRFRLRVVCIPGRMLLHCRKLPRPLSARCPAAAPCSFTETRRHVLSLAWVPLVLAAAAGADACRLHWAAAQAKQVGFALQQPGRGAGRGGRTPMAAAPAAGPVAAGLRRPAASGGAAGGTCASALGAHDRDAGHRHVVEHARQRHQADPPGRRAGCGQAVPAGSSQDHRGRPRHLRRQQPGCPERDARPRGTGHCDRWLPDADGHGRGQRHRAESGGAVPRAGHRACRPARRWQQRQPACAQPGRQGQATAEGHGACGSGFVQLGRDHRS